MFSGVMSSDSHRVKSYVPRNQQEVWRQQSLLAITHFQTLVRWHFGSLKKTVLKIEFPTVLSTKLRSREP